MNAVELIKKIVELGADEKEIVDRFSGNIELYCRCFEEFLGEPSFILLREGIRSQNYKQAFEAAHTLKGISGNLGIAPFYDAIYALVESLRSEEYKFVEMEYAEVLHQCERLEKIRSLLAKEKEADCPKTSDFLTSGSETILREHGTDVEGALQRLNGNDRLYSKCLRAFLEDPSMEQIRAAVKNSDWDGAFTAAHALKGVAGNMGFIPLMHTVGQLVVIIRGGRLQEIEKTMKKVNESYLDIVEGICKCIEVADEKEREEAI